MSLNFSESCFVRFMQMNIVKTYLEVFQAYSPFMKNDLLEVCHGKAVTISHTLRPVNSF